MHVLLVGAGPMAREYAKVLEALEIDYTVICRSVNSAEKFKKTFGVTVIDGGLENVFSSLDVEFTHAIIATTLESLEKNTLFLLEKGIKKILVEKPGAVTNEGINRIKDLSKNVGAEVYIAYNRRFYTSVIEAKKRIIEDDGLKSFLFEFTEWTHQIEGLNKTSFQLENWFIGNSTHVVDTAFYFGGHPVEIQSFVQSELDWHLKGSIFVGAGITVNSIPFSYHANWQAPGSWKLELLTTKNRYIFRPFEQLHVQRIGSNSIEEISLDDSLDQQFKPGLYRQLEKFLFNKKSEDLLSIEDGANVFNWYEQILGKHGGK